MNEQGTRNKEQEGRLPSLKGGGVELFSQSLIVAQPLPGNGDAD